MRYSLANLASDNLFSSRCHSFKVPTSSRSLLTSPSLPTRSFLHAPSNYTHCQHRNCTRVASRVPEHPAVQPQTQSLARPLPDPRSPRNAIRSSILIAFSHLHLDHSRPFAAYKRRFSAFDLRRSYASLLDSSGALGTLGTLGTSLIDTQKPLATRIMARKISNAPSDSSLSPPPDNLMSATETTTVTQPVVNGKKRKAETTPRTRRTRAQQVDVEDAVDGVDESPRPKRRATKKIKVTEEVEDEVMAQESGDGEGKSKKAVSRRNKKTAATKKAVVDDGSVEAEVDAEIEVDADGDDKIATKTSVKKTARGKKSKAKNEDSDHEDKPKPKPKPRAKGKGGTAKILPPLAERTKDSKHLIGAHVSSAGG